MGDYNNAMMRNRDPAVQARTKAQNRANVLQLKLIGQSHPTGLTNELLKLFAPRPPLEYKPPAEKRKCPPYTGMAQFVSQFAEPGQPEYAPPVQKGETPAERKARIRKLRLEKGEVKAAEELLKYDPSKDPNVSGDPYKTLFVARLNYETTEHRIKREFEAYGPIKRVRLITDMDTNKPRGYGFIEYMHTRDMKTAYKQADGRKLDNRRVLVDVERGRTVPNWRPRRLGGGLGSTRVGGEEVNQKNSGREQQQNASGGPPRSEEPRLRDVRHLDRDREKSRERGWDRERGSEKSLERSHDRVREREPRNDRHHHHRDREKNRDRDKEGDRGRNRDRDRARGRDRERDHGRDYDRERDHERSRDQGRERDYDRISRERDRGYTYERETEYDHGEPVRDREQPGTREDDLEQGEHDYRRDWFDDPIKHGHERDYGHEQPRSHGGYDHHQPHELSEPELDRKLSKRHEPDYYEHVSSSKVQRADSEPREEGEAVMEHDYAYQRSRRSLSQEYDQ